MIVDIIVLIVVVGSMIVSFLRGFIREILTIFGIVGGAAAAYIGGPLLSPKMHEWMGITDTEDPDKLLGVISYPLLADITSYVSILIFFVIILSIFSHFFAEFIKNIGLGALDRTLGVIFGFVRGVLVLGLFYLPILYLMTDEDKESYFAESKTHVYLETTSKFIDGFIPKSVEEGIEAGAENLEGISETRKKLEEMNVLGQDGKKEEGEQMEGYSPEFRDDMDKLIEENTDTSPDFNE